jgi:hypothetical protein
MKLFQCWRARACFCAAFLQATPAFAEETFAPRGQPICIERDKLQELVLALIQKDLKWMESLDGCILLKQRSKIAIIEEEDGGEAGHVVKGRVFGPAGSFVGYTLSIGLEKGK